MTDLQHVKRVVALGLLLMISGVTARYHQEEASDASNVDAVAVLDTFATSTWDAVVLTDHSDHGNSRAICNGREIDRPESKDGYEKIECWGKLYWKHSNHSMGAIGAKCDGHFVAIHVPYHHMRVAVCEGLSKLYACKVRTCPKTGASVRSFYGKACLGTGSSIMRYKSDSNSSESVLPKDVASLLTSDEKLNALLAESMQDSEYEGSSVESRCKGYGGEVKAAKRGSSGEAEFDWNADAEDNFVLLQDVVEEAAGIVDVTSEEQLRSSDGDEVEEEIEGDGLTVLLQLAEQSERKTASGMQSAEVANHHVSCEVTCNGRRAWLRGMWPCYGELKAVCSASASRASGRRLLAKQAESMKAIEPAARQSVAHHNGKHAYWSGKCKGLWTGFFGKACMGATLNHGAACWPGGAVDNFDVCSGTYKLRYKKKNGLAAMGHTCKGSDVARRVEMHENDDDDDDNDRDNL